MILPQITYTDETGPRTLTFVYPPTSKPAYDKSATRTDTFSTAGSRQTVVQRVNEKLPISMLNILWGDDVDAWKQFLDWANQGGEFEYYPDAENDADHSTCFLVETDVSLVYVSFGIFSFTGTFQKEIS